MIDKATTPGSGTDEILDLLVPPPRRRSTRVLWWAAFAAVVVIGVWSVTSGTVTPRLDESYVSQWGGSGPVVIGFETTNRSRVAIEITAGPHPRAGLVLRGYTVDDPAASESHGEADIVTDPFPLRLSPGEAVRLTAWYDVADCAAVAGIDRDDQQVDLQIRIADGPFSAFTTTREIDADLSPRADDTTGAASWASVIAQHVCARPE